MEEKGLIEVNNPSELFLSERQNDITGSVIFSSLEGSRPILVEIQALVSNANFGTPQRNVNGFDYKRLAMLLAVLEKRLGILMGTKDVFINLVGGLKSSMGYMGTKTIKDFSIFFILNSITISIVS